MSDTRWFDRAADELESELAEGKISPEKFRREMSELRRELRESERDDGGW